MSRGEKQTIFVRCLVLGVLTSCLVILWNGGATAGRRAGQKHTVPLVAVRPQSDAPLRLNVLSADSSDPSAPEIIYEVTNVSTRPVRAYAVTQETLRGGEKSAGSLLTDLGLSDAALQPGQYSTESITYQPLSEKQNQVTLSVDFVEFSDGTTWGPNTFKSAGTLAGQRAGAVEARRRLLKVYQTEGAQAAKRLLDGPPADVSPPPGSGPEWEEGFRHGYRFVSNRLARIFKSGKLKKFEDELRRLHDR